MELVYLPCVALVFDYIPCLLYDAREGLAYECQCVFKRDFAFPFEPGDAGVAVRLECDEAMSAACPYSKAALVVAHEVCLYDFRM